MEEENPFQGEEESVPISKSATYDLKPEMSAYEIRDSTIAKIESDT